MLLLKPKGAASRVCRLTKLLIDCRMSVRGNVAAIVGKLNSAQTTPQPGPLPRPKPSGAQLPRVALPFPPPSLTNNSTTNSGSSPPNQPVATSSPKQPGQSIKERTANLVASGVPIARPISPNPKPSALPPTGNVEVKPKSGSQEGPNESEAFSKRRNSIADKLLLRLPGSAPAPMPKPSEEKVVADAPADQGKG